MEYPKIETLYERDITTHKLKQPLTLRNSVYAIINRWQWSEKIDGMNIRVMWQDGKLKLGGRTDNANIPADLVQLLYETIDVQKLRDTFGDTPVIIYGEGYGAGIQKGGGYSKTKQFIVFDVLVDNKWWLSWENTRDIATKLGLKTVPFIGEMSLEEGIEMVKNGFDSILAKENTGEIVQAEGLVGRTIETLFDKRVSRIIIKLKTRDF
jgi:ATP-dependent RNA circularization protein (DNA/RNA ligase family)